MYKFLVKFILPIFFIFNLATASVIDKIEISGNKRISTETIKVYGDIKTSKSFNDDDLNSILKKLYGTDFFKDVRINVKDKTLSVFVVENPIIQIFEINGLKKESFLETIKSLIQLKEKKPFIEYQVDSDLKIIESALKQSGFYFSKVKSSIVKNENNTIDLVYDIDLGDRAIIGQIEFIGDKKFKDRKLHNIIVSEEGKFWKILSTKKFLDKQRINLDKRLLKYFYLNRGYYEASVDHTSAQFLDNRSFNLIFNINAGKKFFFNKVNLLLPNDYDPKNFSKILNTLKKLENSEYSINKIEKIINKIDQIALTEEYKFIKASINEEIVENNKIDLTLKINESEKFYVEKINIFGNNITQEEVIRNSLLVDEGDAFNEILHNKSINEIKSRNIFGSVKSKVKPGSSDSMKLIDITVEEKATGEITAGAGFGTSGAAFAFSISENNYLGKGVKLKTKLMMGAGSMRGSFTMVRPNFKYSDKSLSTSVQSSVTDKLDLFGYKNTKTGGSIGTGFEQWEDIWFTPSLSTYVEKIETNSTASKTRKKQEGNYFDTDFHYGLSVDKRNQSFQPSDGYRSSFRQTLPVLSKGYSIINEYQYDKYHKFHDELIGSFSFFTSAINSLDGKDVRISKRLYLPSNKLRGFEVGKIGPKDNKEYVGGNYALSINTTLSLPTLFPSLQKTDFKLFLDVANLWSVDYDDKLDDSGKIRSSTGLAVDWYTPIGPLNFSLAQALTKASTDKTEFFRFNIGTSF